MKEEFPHIAIELNGGLTELETAIADAEGLDGIMLGRAAYHTPWILSDVDAAVYGDTHTGLSREDVAEKIISYAARHEASDRSAKAMVRHIMGLYAGLPGARLWRRTLSETIAKGELPSATIRAALQTRLEHQGAA